jgi:hypothetical protein
MFLSEIDMFKETVIFHTWLGPSFDVSEECGRGCTKGPNGHTPRLEQHDELDLKIREFYNIGKALNKNQ